MSHNSQSSLIRKILGEWRSWVGWVLTVIVIAIAYRNCSYIVATYNDLHQPRVEFGDFHVEGIGNDLYFIRDINNYNSQEDATDIHIKSEAIDLRTKLTEPQTQVIWPRLKRGHYDQVKIKLNSSEFPYLLMCVDYRSESGRKSFSNHSFFVVSGLQAGMSSTAGPWPSREDEDALEANFPCANLQ